VMELHGRLVDEGLEGGVVVRERGKFEGHMGISCWVMRCAGAGQGINESDQ
jgi:hypothetical protein